MLKNLSIKMKLIFTLSVLTVTLFIISLTGNWSLGSSNDSLKTVYEDRLVCLGQLDQVIRLINNNQKEALSAILEQPETATKTISTIEQNIAATDKVWAEYTGTYLTDDEKKLADQFIAQYKQFLDQGLNPVVMALKSNNKESATELALGKLEASYAPAKETINKLIQLQLDVGKSEYEKSQSAYKQFTVQAVVVLLLALGVAIGMGFWLMHSIITPINEAVQVAQTVAAGDLTSNIQIQSDDEVGALLHALKSMNDGLVKIVSQVRSGTDSIATASSQIAAGNLELSSRTEQQAGSLEETAASMEEITATVRQNADNSRQANVLAASASDVAARGGVVVSQVVSTMESINASSKKIVDIISVIDGIAFQTNILALNAAVEAARAGEQGRGFAVVAAEVRSLAQRSASAAKEIKELINTSVEKVDIGSRLVDQAGATMGEVVESVKRVSDIVNEITAASSEQNTGIEQVNQAVIQMDSVTQQNAALVEEAAAAADSLQDQAAKLAELVSVFKIQQQHAGPMASAIPKKAAAKPNTTKKVFSAPRLANTKPAPSERKEPVDNKSSSNKPIQTAAVSEDGWEEF